MFRMKNRPVNTITIPMRLLFSTDSPKKTTEIITINRKYDEITAAVIVGSTPEEPSSMKISNTISSTASTRLWITCFASSLNSSLKKNATVMMNPTRLVMHRNAKWETSSGTYDKNTYCIASKIEIISSNTLASSLFICYWSHIL